MKYQPHVPHAIATSDDRNQLARTMRFVRRNLEPSEIPMFRATSSPERRRNLATMIQAFYLCKWPYNKATAEALDAAAPRLNLQACK